MKEGHLKGRNGPPPGPRIGFVQIAGVRDAAEAGMLAGLGVPYLGFPLRLDHHQPDLSESEAARVIRGLAPRTRAVLITYETRLAEIARLARALGVWGVQLHAEMAPEALAALRPMVPELFLIRSLVVGATADVLATARAAEPHVDAFLTDTFDPQTGARGATGRTHDWSVSRTLVEASKRPVILAGGLTPVNVAEAIRAVRPWGVDSHTGVEGPDGRKDPAKVARFLAEALRPL